MTESLLDDTNDPVDIDENKDYLEELVGDGKKFKDVKDLAKGKYEADRFIAFKNKEFDALRDDYLKLKAEYDGSASLKELVDQLKQQQTTNDNTPVVDGQQKQPTALDPTQIESLFEEKLQRHESARRQEENYRSVSERAKERYGNSYKSVLKQQAEDLRISEARVNQMAREEPELFLHTFGLNTPPQQGDFQAPPRTTQRKDNSAPKLRTWSYYEKMRVERPKDYWLPKTQKQMHLDATELGERFNDQGSLGR